MYARSPFTWFLCGGSLALLALHSTARAQQDAATHQAGAVEQLPDAPAPRIEVAAAEPAGTQDAQQPAPGAASPADSGQQGSSSSQSPAAQPSAEPPAQESQQQKANQQVKQEEHQRVLGIVPNFNLTYLGDQTVSLTVKQKFDLSIHSSIDPVAFIIPFFVAGYNEILDSDQGFLWGVKGLGERAGAAYLDAFDGNMLGNAILPSILHQDPRYYRLGHGRATHRMLYAAATSFICKHDKTGKWEPNYSNVAGNILGGAISNLYYPSSDTGVGLTISTGFIVTAEGAIGAEFDEFWPDISRHVLHKDPTHGLDAQAKAADEAKKRAEKQQQ